MTDDRFEYLPPNADPDDPTRELVWEHDQGPVYMVLNLTAEDIRGIRFALAALRSGEIFAGARDSFELGLRIQHIDEFHASAIEPLHPDEMDAEAE